MRQSRLAVSLIFSVNGFIYANWVARLPRIQEMFQVDNGMLGLILLSLSSGALLAMPFTGWLIIRNGSRKITARAAIAFCLAVPIIPLIPEVWQVMILFFFMGMTTGIMDIAMNAQAVLVEQAYKKPIMSSFHALFSVGMAIGAACGALFTELKINLFWHFLTISLIALSLILWSVFHLVQDKPEVKSNEGAVFRFPKRSLMGIGAIAFCCMIGEGAMADWSTNYMVKISKASPALAPMGLASYSVAMTGGRIFGDRARSHFGDIKLLIFSSLMACVGLSVFLVFIHPFAVIGGLFLVGIGLATVVPIAYSTAGSAPGLPPGVGLAMVSTIGYTGFLFGPPIIGFIADWRDLRFALGFVLILFILMTLISFMKYSRSRVVNQEV